MNNLDFSIIYPNIYVYHNMLDDPQFIIDKAEQDQEWSDWYTFGKIVRGKSGDLYSSESFPTLEDWGSLIDKENRPHYKLILEAFFNASKHYVENSKNTIDNWIFQEPSICKYDPTTNLHKDYAMHYHTDYQPEREDIPGHKYGITVTTYLNDNYSGGEILFKIKNLKTNQIDSCSYKPSAGDIIVFPSKDPYYHAVASVHDNFKYFVRSFWDYSVEPSQDWIDGVNQYGEEEWLEKKNAEAKNKEKIYGNIEWLKENLEVEVDW